MIWKERLKILLDLRICWNRTRRLNGKTIYVPIINGMKVAIHDEPWMSGVLKELFALTNGVFLDVGVNLGQTLIKVKTLDEQREYIGVEANPLCMYYLENLINRNLWQCTIFPVGLSDENSVKELNFYSESIVDQLASIVPTLENNNNPFRKSFVAIFDFKEIERHIDKKIDIIKIDVEGGELEVIKGMHDTIERFQPFIIVEIIPSEKDDAVDEFAVKRQKKVVSMLESLNYGLFRIIKSAEDTYLGLAKLDDLDLVSDVRDKDYVAIPVVIEEQIKDTLTVVSHGHS